MFFKNSFGFVKLRLLALMDSRSRSGIVLPLAHFEEEVDDDDECWDTGGNMSLTFCTLVMNFFNLFFD
jgi:hypothetical protein